MGEINDKTFSQLKANKTITKSDTGLFSRVSSTLKKDTDGVTDFLNDVTSGRGKISSKLDKHVSNFHGVTGNSFFKTALRTAVYGGGLLAAADFLNPLSLGWND